MNQVTFTSYDTSLTLCKVLALALLLVALVGTWVGRPKAERKFNFTDAYMLAIGVLVYLS